MLNNTTSIQYLNNFNNIGILPGPDCYTCGNINLKKQKLSSKNTIFSFVAQKTNINYFIQ